MNDRPVTPVRPVRAVHAIREVELRRAPSYGQLWRWLRFAKQAAARRRSRAAETGAEAPHPDRDLDLRV